MKQLDIYGETQSLAGIDSPKPRDAIAYEQSRLFEPQMEGQLALDEQLPIEGSGTMYVIESDGPAATPSMNRVIDPHTGEVLTFGTRAAARAHADDILPAQPSKYLPLVVREA